MSLNERQLKLHNDPEESKKQDLACLMRFTELPEQLVLGPKPATLHTDLFLDAWKQNDFTFAYYRIPAGETFDNLVQGNSTDELYLAY